MDITGRLRRFARVKRSAGAQTDEATAVRGAQLIDTELAAVGFEVIEELGRGGFGVVYRAHQPAFQRTVAVKVLSGMGAVSQGSHRFEREIKALGSLGDHPHIVTVYDAGTTPSGWPYIVMADMPGGSLADQLRIGLRPDPATVASWGVKLAGALAAAHAQGILHRDIKPENVLIDRFGEPALGDFGIARMRGATETRSGVITGSLAHAAPEILGSGGSSEVSDVYSLGSTLYTLLAGKPAFVDEHDETPHALVARILHAPVPDLVQLGVPSDLAAVVASALAREPGSRAQTAESLGRALQAVQTDHGWTTSPMIVGAGRDPSFDTGDAESQVETPAALDTQPTRTHRVEQLRPPAAALDPSTPTDTTPAPVKRPRAARALTEKSPASRTRAHPRVPQPVLAGIGLAGGLILAAVLLSMADDDLPDRPSEPVAAVKTATTTPSPVPTATAPPTATPSTPLQASTVSPTVEPASATVAPAPVKPAPRARRTTAPRRTTRPRVTPAPAPAPAQPAPAPSSAPPPTQAPPPPPSSPSPSPSPRPAGPGCQDCTDAPSRPGCQDCTGTQANSGWTALPKHARTDKIRST